MNAVVRRIRSVRTVVVRASVPPLLLRCGIFLVAVGAFALAYPLPLLASRAVVGVLMVAALPAFAPNRLWPTFAVVAVAAGWVVRTRWYDEPVALWRLLALATLLYLLHSLCALAALLPYDAAVAPGLLAGWLVRALGVVLAAAVLAVLLVAVAGPRRPDTTVVAALAGLAVAVAVAALLGWLLRRR